MDKVKASIGSKASEYKGWLRGGTRDETRDGERKWTIRINGELPSRVKKLQRGLIVHV